MHRKSIEAFELYDGVDFKVPQTKITFVDLPESLDMSTQVVKDVIARRHYNYNRELRLEPASVLSCLLEDELCDGNTKSVFCVDSAAVETIKGMVQTAVGAAKVVTTARSNLLPYSGS